MPEMTEAEADALDDFVTEYPPKVDPAKARHIVRMVELDDFTADYLFSRSMSTHKTPTELITDMVREKVAASV